ncbi:MAG: site-specific integrase, partial [Actinobacteria bacterium]|nr:site-specific integrase [Actinomycetota bacterium]
SLAHALRHTYATLLVDNGASLPELQRLLGHRDLSTTQVYLAVTGSGLEQLSCRSTISSPSVMLIPATQVCRSCRDRVPSIPTGQGPQTKHGTHLLRCPPETRSKRI